VNVRGRITGATVVAKEGGDESMELRPVGAWADGQLTPAAQAS
jgi:hypothetical protein